MHADQPIDRLGRLILDVALQFGATLDIERLLPMVLARVTELISAERALFALFDEEGRVQRAVVHNLEWNDVDEPLPVSQSVIAAVLEKGDTVVVADAAQDRDFHASMSVRILGLRFIIGVPVHGRGRVVGVLYVDSRADQVKALNAEVEALTALARLVGTAVENARLFEEQRYRARLLAEMVHDFRTPLSVISANAQMLELVTDAEPEEMVEMAGDIAASAQRMGRMVDNTLELSRIDAGAASPSPGFLDLRLELPRHVRAMSSLARPMDLRFAWSVQQDLPLAHTIRDRVWIIFDNLLFNALKHAERGTEIRVEATLRPDPGPPTARERPSAGAGSLFSRQPPLVATPGAPFVQISVHNRGEPIPPDLIGNVFAEYVRGGSEARGVRATGLGLSIVDHCVRHLGGAVWVISEPTFGTRFTFSLPTSVEIGVPQGALPPLTVHDTQPTEAAPLLVAGSGPRD